MNPFIFVLLLVAFVGGFITLWVWLGTRAAFGPHQSGGLERRLGQLETEIRELKDLVASAVIEHDEANWARLEGPAQEGRRLSAGVEHGDAGEQA